MTMVVTEHKSNIGESCSKLYVCLNKEHRVSRSFRATWYIKTLLQTIEPIHLLQDCESSNGVAGEDLGILSVVGGSRVTPNTLVFYICPQYSLVFVIDMSHNMMRVSNSTYKAKIDEAVSSLCASLQLLTQPFKAQGSLVMCHPQLCVTVLAYSGTDAKKPIKVLLQGVYITQRNCEQLVSQLKMDITHYENTLAQGYREDEELARQPAGGDTSLEGMVKAALLGIQLLPRSPLKGLVLLTDGISGFSTPSSMHSTVNNMRSANVSCWVVHVGGEPHPSDALGLVPDTETLAFISRACNGCVMQPSKIMSTHRELVETGKDGCSPNIVQESILFWTFQQTALITRVGGVVSSGWEGHEDPFTPIIYRVFNRNTINAPLLCVLGCKIREGFFLKDLQIRDSLLEVWLYYPWQPSVTIYYIIVAPWPVSEGCESLQATTSYDGPYSFVHDIHCDLNPTIVAPYRSAAVRKFKQALQKFSNSDALLAHFLSFSATPTYHNLPQSAQDKLPLFFLPPNQTKPVPSIEGKAHTPLIQFWRTLCTVDISQWFRWFHSDKIILVLRQDSTLPRHLLQPSHNGRFASIQCRLAASQLFAFLKEWSTFVLLENHTFVRFLPSRESPRYFCLVRVAQKHPCVVLHVGHIEGTPHNVQLDTLQLLVSAVKELSTATPTRRRGATRSEPCATVIDKQLQKVMIRYDSMAGGGSTPTLSITAIAEASLTPMDYLNCTSWQWSVPKEDTLILNALLRRRLKEGYNITSAHNGIVSLTAQLTMDQPGISTKHQLLLQYVIFPFGEHLNSELWVEPQYGTICDTPPGLSYLIGARHSEITDKVHAMDLQLVEEVGSFLYLHHCCKDMKPATAEDDDVIDEETGITFFADVNVCRISFKPSVLFVKSQALAFTLAAFSEASSIPSRGPSPDLHLAPPISGTLSKASSVLSLDLSSCSDLNRLFWFHLKGQLKQLAPTELTSFDQHQLQSRISSSPQLTDLQQLFIQSDINSVKWLAFSLAHEDSICMVFVATNFFPRGTEGNTVLPVVLLQCTQSILVDRDPTQPEVSSLSPDVYRHLPLAASHTPLPSMTSSLRDVLDQLHRIHVSSFLHTLNMALKQRLPLISQDFQVGIGVCEQAKLSVDVTPMMAALCSHSLVLFASSEEQDSAPLSTQHLCQLLEASLSKKTGVCCVGMNDEDTESLGTCSSLKNDVDASFMRYLHNAGFQEVPQCPTHFWLDMETEAPEDQEELTTGGHIERYIMSSATPFSAPQGDSVVVVSDDVIDGEPHLLPSSVISETSTLQHASSDQSDLIMTTGTGSSDEEFFPLLSPTNEEEFPPNKPSQILPSSPLFLTVGCTVKDRHGNSSPLTLSKAGLPICSKKVGEVPGEWFSVSMQLVFFSFNWQQQTSSKDGHHTTSSSSLEKQGSNGESVNHSLASSSLPLSYHSIAAKLQQKLQWIVSDELVSIAFNATPITPPLLMGVAAHVQATCSQKLSETSCFSRHVPLKFVCGVQLSLPHFTHQLEAISVPYYSIVKKEDCFYLSPKPHPPDPSLSYELTPEPSPTDLRVMNLPNKERGRSVTPPPASLVNKSSTHRRSQSSGCTMSFPPDLKTASHPTSAFGSVTSMVSSGYEASKSCSVSSVSESLSVMTPERVDGFWLILRVLPHQADLYFQIRGSLSTVAEQLGKLEGVCREVEEAVRKKCHETNQWFLLKEMLETRMCSPYLLPVSASEAWVDEVVQNAGEQQGRLNREMFKPQQFMCELQWKRHITPHWRVTAMKTQATLRIARASMDAFAVSNRKDVYVLQDVKPSGEETIFYLKIDESLCRVEDESSMDDSEQQERCETRATMDGVESLSSFSMQQSISEVAVPDLERKGTGTSLDVSPFQSGKPQESLVLQLYGITRPTQDLMARLSYLIQHKLDDAALEILSGQYARNQHLKLTVADVQFLQPPNEATYVLGVAIPSWVNEIEAFLFYFLQSLSFTALKPRYVTHDSRDHFQTPRELQNAYLVTGLPGEIHEDHIFIYIRPHTKGRGMGVVSVNLVSPSGRMVAPEPGVVTKDSCYCDLDQTKLEELDSEFQELGLEESLSSTQYCLHVHVWEKGNIGLAEFSKKLSQCFKQALCDYIIELCLLTEPVATPLPEAFDERSETNSPFTVIPLPTDDIIDSFEHSTSRRNSGIPPSRRTSEMSPAGSRRGSEKSPAGSRRGSEKSPAGSRRGSEKSSASRRESEKSVVSLRRSSGEQGSKFTRRDVKVPDRSVSAPMSATPPPSLYNRKLSRQGSEEKTAGGGELDRTQELGSFTHTIGDIPVRERRGTQEIINELDEASIEGSESLTAGGSGWVEKLKMDREKEARQAIFHEACIGRAGVLEHSYHITLPLFLSQALQLTSPSVKHTSFHLNDNHSADALIARFKQRIQETYSDFTVEVFRGTPDGSYQHCSLFKEKTIISRSLRTTGNNRDELEEASYIAVGRCVEQFEETLDPTNPGKRITKAWLDPVTKQPSQLFQPLDSKKITQSREIPFATMATTRELFIPRQRVALLKVTNKKVELWVYNVAELLTRQLLTALQREEEWQCARSGVLHILLSQKMGLFQHTHGTDCQRASKLTMKISRSRSENVALIKGTAPTEAVSTPSRAHLLLQRPVYPTMSDQVNLELFYMYQDCVPSVRGEQSVDPVFNHGTHFRNAHSNHRRQYESHGLLAKVFRSWQSRSSAPVNPNSISALKRLARLFHYCTSPLLLHQCVPAKPNTAETEAQNTWFDNIKSELISLYIRYLQSLGFQEINEREVVPSFKQKHSGQQATLTPSSSLPNLSSLKLYKCLQRSWVGGIILMELMFHQDKFMVKLFTLESTRLVNQPQSTPAVDSTFSAECARYKDFIHVHSFMHDFHLSLLLGILNGTRSPPARFDTRKLLELCYKRNNPPPSFIRNLLKRGCITVPSTVDPPDLYQHLVVHCNTFGTNTLELKMGGTTSSNPLPEDIALFIDVSRESLGPMTSPELSKLLEDTQATYSIRVLALFTPEGVHDKAHILKLVFYLLLVNKFDQFPRLTCDSQPTSHPLPTSSSSHTSSIDTEDEESALGLKVREHRRRLGFGSLSSPSAASQVVLNTSLIDEQMRNVQSHLENVVRNALYHMRRDELWKRLLYGHAPSHRDLSDSRPTAMNFVQPTCREFQELIQLVTVCHLDALDPRLSVFKKQNRKWYRKLMVSLEVRFADNIRMFNTDDEHWKYAAIINPDWQDMFILVQTDRDQRHNRISALYRKPREGGVPIKERLITAHVEADRQHIETVVNFACSFLWASILDTSPPQPQLSLL